MHTFHARGVEFAASRLMKSSESSAEIQRATHVPNPYLYLESAAAELTGSVFALVMGMPGNVLKLQLLRAERAGRCRPYSHIVSDARALQCPLRYRMRKPVRMDA